MTATFSYDAWGNLTGSSGTATTPFQFAGAYLDSSNGLYYLRARWYDAASGQFMSLDPQVASTLEAYDYVGNDPLNGLIPTGLCNENAGKHFLYPGGCAKTGKQALADEAWIQAHAGGSGFSISKGFDAVMHAAKVVGAHSAQIADVRRAVGVCIAASAGICAVAVVASTVVGVGVNIAQHHRGEIPTTIAFGIVGVATAGIGGLTEKSGKSCRLRGRSQWFEIPQPGTSIPFRLGARCLALVPRSDCSARGFLAST